MTIELLKSNINREKEIVREMNLFYNQLHQLSMKNDGRISSEDKKLITDSINSLSKQLEIINNALPDLINNVQFFQKLSQASPAEYKQDREDKSKNLLKVRYDASEDQKQKIELAIKKQDQVKFLENVALAKNASEKLKEKGIKPEIRETGLGKFGFYIRLSNKFFRKTADKLIAKKYFSSVNRNLRKITSPFIIQSYVSLALFSTALAFILGIILSIFALIFKLPIVAILLVFGLPLITFALFYIYPSSERKNLEKEINQELPFVAIYLGAVATSGIEPSRIFEIVIKTKDYPFTQREMKKLLNYINFYGYDLVNALRLSSKSSPSEKLSMLFNGLATTISSGGLLTEFLSKHAEWLLFDYRLEREKYTHVAETFMDIYISVVIAAPMIMMILFVLITLTGYASSFSSPLILRLLVIFVVSILNIGFLFFLNLKQPKF